MCQQADQTSAPLPEPTEPTRPESLLARCFILLVRFYQVGISPLLGNNCRFYPSCSEYFILAVRKYGALRGALRGIGRICRCHPFHPGGVDYP